MSKRVPGSGQTMLILAAETGHLETLEVVLDQLDEKGLLAQTINLKDSDGHTALIHAAHSPISDSDLAQFVSLLVSAGADLNAKDRKQKTASDIAQDRGRAETARLLRGEVPPMPRQVDCDDDDD
jgi:ankyrin repeat protein